MEAYSFRVLSVATALVTMSSKDKNPLEKQSDSCLFGMNAGPSDLEPGTHY
jgi:hypothetical protein